MIISIVVAMDENRGIGYRNKLPWHVSEELKYFRKLTIGKPVIMGRKTFSSLNNQPLPKRKNIILTKNKNFVADQVEITHSAQEAIEKADGKECMVIGGLEIYNTFLPLAHRIYVSIIPHEFKCDTFFPEIDLFKWQIISEENHGEFISKVYVNKS